MLMLAKAYLFWESNIIFVQISAFRQSSAFFNPITNGLLLINLKCADFFKRGLKAKSTRTSKVRRIAID